MKKKYIIPEIATTEMVVCSIIAASQLDETLDSQTIATTEDEYDEEFVAKPRYHWQNEVFEEEAVGIEDNWLRDW